MEKTKNNMKENLIKLFKKTCDNFSVSRSNNGINMNIDSDTRDKIINLLPKEITIPHKKVLNRPFKTDDVYFPRLLIGFNFKDEPPTAVAVIKKRYQVKYGWFVPLISFLFLNNYKRRKIYNIYAKSHAEDCWCDVLCKTVSFSQKAYFIIHGTLMAEISEKECGELISLYKQKVKEFDLYQLKKRLEE